MNSPAVNGAERRRQPSTKWIAGLVGACALALVAAPAPASAVGEGIGPGDVRTAHCPAGRIVQLQWQNTGDVDLFGTPGRHLNLNDYVATYHAGSNSYNTGVSDFTWGYGNSSSGSIVEGTSTFICVSFRL